MQLLKAQAFVLVYSITDENSFLEVKNLWEQIKKVRPNILDVPCVIVGNNLDEENVRQVETFDAFFPDKLDLRFFFMRIDSLHLRSFCYFSLCILRQ
jgi:GTPase SAR1 family protein